ncbi:MAG TPA: endo alpha-1,4 polygalactosaminidase [Candidatus Cybelea sp.]
MIARSAHAILAASLLAACAGLTETPKAPGMLPGAAASQARWIPAAGDSYEIQYDGKLDTGIHAGIYDLDMFDTPAAVVAKLHKMGRHVICYVDVGTWENWRPDAKKFPKSVLGNKDGHWKGERWLDVRATSILEPIMAHRLELCKQKRFDGVDPDNLDGYQNRTGFPITYQEQLSYDTWVAKAAHDRGLTAAQKGDDGQVNDLVKVFDFAVVEQCFTQRWCKKFDVYTNGNRLVVDGEYYRNQMRFQQKNCPEALQNHDTAILKKLQLTAWIVTCGT